MMISTKGRYALRVMVDLAENVSNGHTPLKEIAQRQEISEKYLESILKILVRNGLLVGLRGKGGGYRLTRDASQYTVGEILRLTEGGLSQVPCLAGEDGDCSRMSSCRTVEMWRGLDKVINDYLDGITVADLAEHIDEGNYYVI